MNNLRLQKLIRRFRLIGIAEGISFLILLCIAMPLKYFFHFPQAVKIFGWVHGALFVTFIYFAFEVMAGLKKNIGWLAKAFFAAIIPLGTFFLDKQLKTEEILLQS